MARKPMIPTEAQLEVLRSMNATQARKALGLSRNLIRRWLREYLEEVPRVRGRPCRTLPEDLQAELGHAPDTSLADRYKVPLSTIRNHRQRLGIEAYEAHKKPLPQPQASQEVQQASQQDVA